MHCCKPDTDFLLAGEAKQIRSRLNPNKYAGINVQQLNILRKAGLPKIVRSFLDIEIVNYGEDPEYKKVNIPADKLNDFLNIH